MSPRRPPVSEIHRLHLPRQAGKCDWCGLPQEERTPVRKQLKLRHSVCDTELNIVQNPAAARAALWVRDSGVCAGCGGDFAFAHHYVPERKRPDGTAGTSFAFNNDRTGHWFADDSAVLGRGANAVLGVLFTPVRSISMWHVDHKVPLWKVAHMPAIERVAFFKLPNLQTLCDQCHERKSAKETAERHHFDRLARSPKERLPW